MVLVPAERARRRHPLGARCRNDRPFSTAPRYAASSSPDEIRLRKTVLLRRSFALDSAMNVATTSALELLMPASAGRSAAYAMSAPRYTRSKFDDSRLTTVATYCVHDAWLTRHRRHEVRLEHRALVDRNRPHDRSHDAARPARRIRAPARTPGSARRHSRCACRVPRCGRAPRATSAAESAWTVLRALSASSYSLAFATASVFRNAQLDEFFHQELGSESNSKLVSRKLVESNFTRTQSQALSSLEIRL